MKGHDRANPESEPTPKRHRITVKGGISSAGDNWREVIEEITPTLPRVGKQEITDSKLVQKMQTLLADKQSVQVIGGRGYRTTAPIRQLGRVEAPFRKMIFVHRQTNKIHDHLPWELWEDLPKRKLVRTGYPSKVAITIFAVNPSTERGPTATGSQSGESGTDQSIELPDATPVSMASPKLHPENPTSEDQEVFQENHGPAVMKLSREDRALLVKIHKNAGHPGPDKLAYLLRQQGYRPELVAAVPDLACSACAMLSRPKISRPSAIHSPHDRFQRQHFDGWIYMEESTGNFFSLLSCCRCKYEFPSCSICTKSICRTRH